MISIETLFKKFREGNALIVDVRDENEFAMAHIPGSLNIPQSEILNAYKSIPESEEVFVVSDESQASIGAALLLKLKRINAQAVSPGGIKNWINSGFPMAE
ncbi:MAG: rhodanese-like domain-containing protein [Schleiferiaceae bacterium]|jgi:rhodanese-related sulfurtransferase|nr:rhodanese-like domain-containing protein [Schleiferiaceae bacterium]